MRNKQQVLSPAVMTAGMKTSRKRLIAQTTIVTSLLVGALVAGASAFMQSQQPAQQPPRPAIAQTSPEEAAREMNNPRSKWFREAKFGLFISEQAKQWRCTTRPGRIYIHFFTWPAGQFNLEGVKGKVARAYLLADPKHNRLKFEQVDGKVTVSLPERAPGEFASVLCLETR